jgi:predicted permease
LIFVFRLDGVWAASCFILSALPTASIVYIIANNYQVASNKISVLTLKITICSLFTVSFCIMIAKYLWPIAFIT